MSLFWIMHRAWSFGDSECNWNFSHLPSGCPKFPSEDVFILMSVHIPNF